MNNLKITDKVSYTFDDDLYHAKSIRSRFGDDDWGEFLEKNVEMPLGVILLTALSNMSEEIVYRHISEANQKVDDNLIKERVSRLEKIFEHYLSILHPQEIKNFGMTFFSEIENNADMKMKPYYQEMFGLEKIYVQRWMACGVYFRSIDWKKFKYGFEILSKINKKHPFCEVKYIELNDKDEESYPLVLDKLTTMITAQKLVGFFASQEVLKKFNNKMGEYERKAIEDYFENGVHKKASLGAYKNKVLLRGFNCSDNKNILDLCVKFIENSLAKEMFNKDVNDAFQILSLSVEYGWELEKKLRKDRGFYIKNLYTIKESLDNQDMVEMYINHEIIQNIVRLSFIGKNNNKEVTVLFENSFFESSEIIFGWYLSESNWIKCSEINEKIYEAKREMVWAGDEMQDENNIAFLVGCWEKKVKEMLRTDCELFMGKSPLNDYLNLNQNRAYILMEALKKIGENIDVTYLPAGVDNPNGLLMSKLKFNKKLVPVMKDIVDEVSFLGKSLCEEYIEKKLTDWVMRKDLNEQNIILSKKKLNKF